MVRSPISRGSLRASLLACRRRRRSSRPDPATRRSQTGAHLPWLYLTADCRAKAVEAYAAKEDLQLAIKLGPPVDTLYVAEGLEDAMTAQQASRRANPRLEAAARQDNVPNANLRPDAVKTVVFPGQNDKGLIAPTQQDVRAE